MSVTIDSLQIEIQSNSTGAVAGIDALAVSLGKLKQNGSVGVAVKNLNNLYAALKGMTTVTSNANKISTLADAMSKLKAVGSAGNGVKKLAESLQSLKNVDYTSLTRVANSSALFEKIATSLGTLSNVKTGGFSTMINSLAKIGDVTDKLDDESITKFASRVKKLSDALGPLSAKMTTIQAGLRGVNNSAKTAGSGVKQLGTKVNVTTLNLASMVTVIQGITAALMPVVRLLSSTIMQAIEWDGVAARFGRGFGNQASEVYDWVQRLNDEMGINTQQFMQYSSVFSTMLQGFGVGLEDSSKMALGYTELIYDIWAGYNDVYKNFGDAADAVKSAIAGEVEPIRRAGFTIVEATLEQTAANHGLEISLEKATEAQKSYLRYLTLVDQAHAQNLVGTYARELNTAEGVMRAFSQQLKSLAQTFGSVFLPILVKIMPWLQAVVELIGEAVIALAGFFGIEIQKVDFSSGVGGLGSVGDAADSATGSLEDTAGAVGSTTDALKDLKKAVIGIDELNVISPPDKRNGSGGAGSDDPGGSGWDDLDVDSLWDETVFDQIQSQVDAIKEKFKEWLPVLEIIGGALVGLGIANLLANMGEALSQMNTLQKLLATVAIVAIEAALVFTFADEYLESGNLLHLISEALVTAAGSYLLFKAWGPKGAVLGLAVSIAAQLAAITLNVADGTVDVSDPELWLQTAMTSLTGAAAGLFAFKEIAAVGAGKGAILGAVISLSLSLAAITLGGVTADGFDLTDGLTGALSTALGGAAGAGLFSLLGVASGGTGFLVGAGIMLAVNVIGAIVASVTTDAEKSLEKDLEERFGDVELSVSEIHIIINKLLPEWTSDVIDTVELRESVEVLRDRIDSEIKTMDRLEWKVSVGLALTEDEMKQYRSAVESFITTTQEYIDSRGYALEVGLKATGASDFVIETSNSISSAASGELQRLGKKLQDTVNRAYEDGLLDIDEMKAIETIRKDMLEIVNALSSSEMEAEFGILEMKWSGVNLTPDSFTTMMSEWRTVLNDKVKPALEDTVKENLKTLEGNVAFAKMNLEKNPGDAEAKQMLEDAEAALQDYMDSNPLEDLTIDANIRAVKFALNTLQDAFAEEIKRIENSDFKLDYEWNLDLAMQLRPDIKWGEAGDEVYGQIAIVVADIGAFMSEASGKLSKEARKNLESMLEAITPTMADFEKIATENGKIGRSVPKEIRNGLNDYNELKALAGDVDGINYLIGKGFSTDSVFLNTLSKVENAGKQVDVSVAKGLLANIDYVTDEATGVVLGIRNAVTGEVTYITPTLKKNMEQLGVNLGDALGSKYTYVYDETTGVLKAVKDSATGNMVWVNKDLKKAGESAGASLSEGVESGAKSGMQSKKKSLLDWALWAWNWFKEANEINSPSKLFERGGKNLVEGLENGVKKNTLKDKLADLWETAKNWWNGKRNLEKANVSVSLVKSGWTTVKGWVGNIPKLSQAVGLAKSGWSSVKSWVGSMPKVSQKVGLAKSGWSSVKGWIGSMPTVKAKVGLAKSGWTSVKKWLGDLDYKLNFKLPKIGVKWGTKEVLGFKISFPSSFYTYAKGGFPDMGELFIAREAGPEMVGKMGRKTTVANNQQIVEGISEGVYAAVVAAMQASPAGGERTINVMLPDGRVLASYVDKSQRERGASIMGNQVYAY